MATDLQLDWDHLIGAWQSLEHGQKGDWYKRLQQRCFPKKSAKAVKALFHRERRRRRQKMKESPKPGDPRKLEICKIIMEMKEKGKQRSDSPRELATRRCIDRLERRGIIKEGAISSSHVNTILREKLGYREETPRVRWEVDRALAEVQTDGTTSKFYRPWKTSDDGSDVLLKASGRPLRYKGREKDKPKVILWGFQDKYSRLRIVRGIPGKAESTLMMLATMQFWLGRGQDRHPMRNLPWGFGHDNGAPFKTPEWEHLVRAFELDPDDPGDNRSSVPYEKTGIGTIERSWQTIWQLELQWSEDYNTIWLSEYNDLLHEALADEQKMKHPYFNGYRGDIYQKSLLNQAPRPRVLGQDVFSLAMKRYERKVTSELNISIDNVKYSVPQYYQGYSTKGEWLVAWKNWRGELVAELRDKPCSQAFDLQPFAHQMKGEYRSYERTATQRMKDHINQGEGFYEAVMSGQMSINGDGEYVNEATGEVLEVQGKAKVERLQPADEEIVANSPFADRPSPEPPSKGDTFASAFKAKAWIGGQLAGYGVTYADVAAHFDSIIDGGLEKDVIAGAVAELVEEINVKSKTGS